MPTLASNFANNYLETLADIGLWAVSHPYAYLTTALLVNAVTITTGAQFGDWSMVGILKFWLATTATAFVVSTPTFMLAMWATKE